MKIKSLGNNKTELHLKHTILLISYETPVALRYTNTRGVLKTEKFHSGTTSKHINQWFESCGLDSKLVPTMPQKWFNDLLKDNTG